MTCRMIRFNVFAQSCSIGGCCYGDQDPSVEHEMSTTLLRSLKSLKRHESYQPCTGCQENVRNCTVQGQGRYIHVQFIGKPSPGPVLLLGGSVQQVVSAVCSVLNTCVSVCMYVGNTQPQPV